MGEEGFKSWKAVVWDEREKGERDLDVRFKGIAQRPKTQKFQLARILLPAIVQNKRMCKRCKSVLAASGRGEQARQATDQPTNQSPFASR